MINCLNDKHLCFLSSTIIREQFIWIALSQYRVAFTTQHQLLTNQRQPIFSYDCHPNSSTITWIKCCEQYTIAETHHIRLPGLRSQLWDDSTLLRNLCRSLADQYVIVWQHAFNINLSDIGKPSPISVKINLLFCIVLLFVLLFVSHY